jgi:hypothetical protein
MARMATEDSRDATRGVGIGAADATRTADRTPTYVILFGGCDRAAFRLRLAQAHLRNGLWPSHWSYVVLLDAPQAEFSKTDLYEISLQPRLGFEPIDLNGLQPNTIPDSNSASADSIVTRSRASRSGSWRSVGRRLRSDGGTCLNN